MDYRSHYEAARGAAGPQTARAPLYDLGLRVARPGVSEGPQLYEAAAAARWMAAVDRVAGQAREIWGDASRQFEPEGRAAGEDRLFIAARDPLAVEGLEDLCAMVIPRLEAGLFGCPVHVERVALYRSLCVEAEPNVSFLWHYDNHPDEIIKLMVYLDDVDEGAGPITFLSNPLTGQPQRMQSTRKGSREWGEPEWPWARIPSEQIEVWKGQGLEERPVVGPKGTAILFSQNCVHRATIPTQRPRDVLLLQMRPSHRKLRPHIDPRWTGTGAHAPLVPDPQQLAPVTREAYPAHFPQVTSRGAGATAPTVTAEEVIALDDMNPRVADLLWRHLAQGMVGEWVERAGAMGQMAPTLERALEAWDFALESEAFSETHGESARLMQRRIRARRQAAAGIGQIYRASAQDTARVFWPTQESEELYRVDLCPKKPRFITPETRIGSMGSCFAINVGKALRGWGMNYLVTEEAPAGMDAETASLKGYGHFTARYGTIFNTPSMRQVVERAFGRFDPEPLLYRFAGSGPKHGKWLDPYREEVCFDDHEEFAGSQPVLIEAIRRAFTEADVFVLTLGVNEVWRFVHDGSTMSRVPWGTAPTLLEPHILDAEENLDHLQRMLDLWQHHNPGIRIIVTVSPVPLLATFREDVNVVVANQHSKATLRVTAEEFARRNDAVFYFPAFEAVTQGTRRPFIADGRHVTDEAIDRVMTQFHDSFVADSARVSTGRPPVAAAGSPA